MPRPKLSMMAKLFIATALGIGAMFLPGRNNTYTVSSCWGHAGCDYFTRVSSPVDWIAPLIASFCAIYFCRTILPEKPKQKWLLTIAFFVAIGIATVSTPPNMVFGDRWGNPVCKNCVIVKDQIRQAPLTHIPSPPPKE